MKRSFVHFVGWSYRHIGAPIFFLFDSEPIHDWFVRLGLRLGRTPGLPALMGCLLRVHDPMLHTSVAGIDFENPIGLAAGFDHEARLPLIIGSLGFGFESVGTVTNGAYGGNPYPRMKRLVKSRSILVNKGFKSTGMRAVIARLKGQSWQVPIGISIGRTNSLEHRDHADAIRDIVEAYTLARDSGLPFSYFELNISCPNLLKDIVFYDPEHLSMLLAAIAELKLPKPLFIKMTIALGDEETKALLDVMLRFPVAAVIIGNLRHGRSPVGFDPAELAKYGSFKGNWSGMPCQSRSDELVLLAYRHTQGKLPIIGCGGIFTAEDAYRKIRLGASLVQLVTATIFEGPQVAAELNIEIPRLLKRDGFKTIAEAVGADTAF